MQIEATRARLRSVGARLLNRTLVRAWGTWTGVASARRRMQLVATREGMVVLKPKDLDVMGQPSR